MVSVAHLHPNDQATFAELIRLFIQARKDLGWTQDKVAGLLGFSPQRVGDIERGEIAAFGGLAIYARALGLRLVFELEEIEEET